MTADTGEDVQPVRRLHRLPLDVVATATGQHTSGVIVAVHVEQLDALEDLLYDLCNFTAGVAGHFEDKASGHNVAGDEVAIRDEADRLWRRLVPISDEIQHEADAATNGGTDG